MGDEAILRLATCQFAVGSSIARNAKQVQRQMRSAAEEGAGLVHFPECALSGYAGTDFSSWESFNWDALVRHTQDICRLAAELELWTVLGSAHRLTAPHRPHNCLYVIGPDGSIVDRYDKRFCTKRDLKHYSAGDHLVTFEVGGVRCGALICYDSRFPELYRAYKKLGVQCILHSFYNARGPGPNVLTVVMPVTIQTRAATNAMWVSAPNASGRYQSWSSVFVLPDGTVGGRLRRHTAQVMVNNVDTAKSFYDAGGANRGRAMRGILHSGRAVSDRRSRDRRSL
jgi:predicted amidohydrolase